MFHPRRNKRLLGINEQLSLPRICVGDSRRQYRVAAHHFSDEIAKHHPASIRVCRVRYLRCQGGCPLLWRGSTVDLPQLCSVRIESSLINALPIPDNLNT